MAKKSPSAPAPVDAAALSRAQTAGSKDVAVAQQGLNSVNQYTPFGSLEFSQSGTWSDGTPRFSATQTLTPQQQRIADLSQNASETYGQTGNALLNNVKGMLSQPVDMSQFGAQPTYNTAFRDAQRQALLTRLQPERDQRRSSLETQLANQGITLGSQAYSDAMANLSRADNDLLLAADVNASNIAGTDYAREMQSRMNRINEAFLPRQMAINEAGALASGNQLQMPSFMNTPQTGIANTDLIGAQGMQQAGLQNAYNQQIGQQNAAMGGLFGLGGALGGGYMASGGRFW